jgi:hypothetical protein
MQDVCRAVSLCPMTIQYSESQKVTPMQDVCTAGVILAFLVSSCHKTHVIHQYFQSVICRAITRDPNTHLNNKKRQ